MTLEKMQENVRTYEVHNKGYMDGDFTVLGLLGPAGSGKDLVADWFVETKNFVKIAFADPMKRFVSKAFGIDWERLWGPSEKRNEMFDIDEAWWFEVIGHLGGASEEIVTQVLEDGVKVQGYLKLHDWLIALRKAYPNKISARVILQTLGTEWGRAVDPLMWARYAFKTIHIIKEDPDIRYEQDWGLGRSHSSPYLGAIISDHRFRNELEYTKSQGGYVLRLRRLANEQVKAVGITGHQSEAEHKELPDDLFDVVFNFPEGVSKVHELLGAAYTEKLWTKGDTQRMHLL